MPVVDKIAALLDALTPADLQALPPIRRRRFADLCRHWADLADRRNDAPKTGILSDLKRGLRCE